MLLPSFISFIVSAKISACLLAAAVILFFAASTLAAASISLLLSTKPKVSVLAMSRMKLKKFLNRPVPAPSIEAKPVTARTIQPIGLERPANNATAVPITVASVPRMVPTP